MLEDAYPNPTSEVRYIVKTMITSVKLLAINSSPRLEGNTAKILEKFIKAAEKLGAEVVRLDLYQEDIPPVTGELNLKLNEPLRIQQELAYCDGFVIATPTYWFNVPGVLKNLLDHMAQLEDNGWLLEGKVGGFIVYSPEGGEVGVLQALVLPLNHQGVLIPPYATIFYRGKQDKWALDDIPLLAKNMIQMIKAQKQLEFNWGY